MRSMVALAAPLLASMAVAEPPPSDEIVVEGRARLGDEERAQAQSFTHRFATFHADDSLSRWNEAVCPRAQGLPDDQVALVEGWVRDVARQAGAPVEDGSCRGNFIVVFVTDAPAFVQRVRTINPWAVKGLNGPDVRRLAEGDQPVRWWSIVERRGGGTGSLLAPVVSNLIVASVVVVDVSRAENVRLKALSELAAFAGLADIRNGAQSPAPSILNLFATAKRAGALSEWDRTFLHTLYSLPHDRRGGYQRARLVEALLAMPPAARKEGGSRSAGVEDR